MTLFQSNSVTGCGQGYLIQYCHRSTQQAPVSSHNSSARCQHHGHRVRWRYYQGPPVDEANVTRDKQVSNTWLTCSVTSFSAAINGRASAINLGGPSRGRSVIDKSTICCNGGVNSARRRFFTPVGGLRRCAAPRADSNPRNIISNFIHHQIMIGNNKNKTNKQIEIINIYATLTTSVQKTLLHTLYYCLVDIAINYAS